MKPISGKVLRKLEKQEEYCEKQSRKTIPKLGKRAALGYEYLAQLILQAELIGTCVYGCPGPGDEKAHEIWFVVARSSSMGRAALRLMRMGFYDEALILVRSLGEIANLLSMFNLRPETIEEWKQSDRTYRLRNLSPKLIRKRIEDAGKTPPMTFEKYSALCEVSTHPVPNLRPQGFNHVGRSMVGGVFVQDAGLAVVLNEMATVFPWLVILAAKVCKVPKEPFRDIKEICVQCLRHAGNVDILNVKEMLALILKSRKP